MKRLGHPLQKDSACTLKLLKRRQILKFAAIAATSSILEVASHYTNPMGAITSSPSFAVAANSPLIRMGVVGLSFYRVVGGIVQNVLESLGHPVAITEGSHSEIFPVLGQGDLDLLIAVWLPNGHGPLFEEYGSQAIELGQLYDDARFFWGVPDYLPETITSIADLTRPDVANQMTQVIQGIGPGAGITRLSQEIMTRYGLDTAGYEFRTGTEQEWVNAFRQGVAAERGVIIPLWQPQYLNRAFAIRRLDDPLAVFPTPDRCSLVITQNFRDRAPQVTLDVLSRISLNVEAVTEMDYWTNIEGLSPREAATQWMAQNPEVVRSWGVPAS